MVRRATDLETAGKNDKEAKAMVARAPARTPMNYMHYNIRAKARAKADMAGRKDGRMHITIFLKVEEKEKGSAAIATHVVSRATPQQSVRARAKEKARWHMHSRTMPVTFGHRGMSTRMLGVITATPRAQLQTVPTLQV